MKPPSFLLISSLAANLVLTALLGRRGAAPQVAAPPPVPVPAAVTCPAAAEPVTVEQVLAMLEGADLAALNAAGASPNRLAQIRVVRAFLRWTSVVVTDPPRTEYWRNIRPPFSEVQAPQAEMMAALEALLGGTFSIYEDGEEHAFLSAESRSRIREIKRDYELLQNEITNATGGMVLGWDRETLRLLERERERDIAAVLTPTERELVELRRSRSGWIVLTGFGDIIASEAEFQALLAARKRFDDWEANVPHTQEERVAALRSLNDEHRALLGNERWATVSNNGDTDAERVTRLCNRLGLPATTANDVLGLRANCGAESVAIHQDTFLSAAARSAQIAAIGVRAKAELERLLGAEAAALCSQELEWLRLLKQGTAYTTDPRQLPPGSWRPNREVLHRLPAR